MGFSKFHEVALYLCEASVVLEDILNDAKTSGLDPDTIKNAKEYLERLNEYLDVSAITG